MARDSDAAVCAEGIETLGDLVRLADLDVTFGQGYVIARPARRGSPLPPRWSMPASSRSPRRCRCRGATTSSTSWRSWPARATATTSPPPTAPIARELRADHIVLDAVARSSSDEVVQVLSGLRGRCARRPGAARRGGHRSLLRVPVTCEGAVVGALEAYRESERPWSRFEIRCARMIAYQLGATIARLTPARPAA